MESWVEPVGEASAPSGVCAGLSKKTRDVEAGVEEGATAGVEAVEMGPEPAWGSGPEGKMVAELPACREGLEGASERTAVGPAAEEVVGCLMVEEKWSRRDVREVPLLQLEATEWDQ